MAALEKMTSAQLDAYALEKGISIEKAANKNEKIVLISEAELHEQEPIRFNVMGVSGSIDAAKFDDFEVFEYIGELEDGNPFVLPKLFKTLFGDDWSRIAAELKGDDARLTISRASLFFVELMKDSEAKN